MIRIGLMTLCPFKSCCRMDCFGFQYATALLPVFLAACMVSATGWAQTFPSSEKAVHSLADQIAKQINGKGKSTFVLNNIRSAGATDLEQTYLLRDRLKELGLREEPGGIDIEGRLSPINETVSGGKVVLIGFRAKFVLEDPDGRDSFLPVEGQVENALEAGGKVGKTGAQRDQPPKNKGDPFVKIDGQAQGGYLRGNRVYPERHSPYSIEILARQAKDLSAPFVPKQLVEEAGVLTVILNRGEEYRIRVNNESGYEAYAALSIDGVRRFRLSKESKNRNNVDLIAARGSSELLGYYIDPRKTSAFLVGEYEDSVAVKLFGEAPDIGVISVVLGVSYSPGEEPEGVEVESATTTRTYTVNVPVMEQREQTYTVLVDGKPETKTRTVTVTKTVTEERQKEVQVVRAPGESQLVGTTQGRDLNAPIQVVPRKLGLVRGTVRIRYHAE